MPLQLIAVNSKEAIEYVSTYRQILEKYNKLVKQYRTLGICFIYSDIEDVTIPYSAPELMKRFFTGGLSIPVVIGCIGFAATAIGAAITVGNSFATVYTSGKALSLSGNPFDDDPGAARYYGNATKLSEAFDKYDYGDETANANLKAAGKKIDTTKAVADTVAFVCNIASLGNVRDYRVTTRTDNINWRYNGNKWYRGYSFTFDNIKRNILHDMGRTVTTGSFKDGSVGVKLISADTVYFRYLRI